MSSLFSFLLKIENNFSDPPLKIPFSFFHKNENEIFFISFFKKWKWNFNELVSQFSKKKRKLNYLSSFFKFKGKEKMKTEILRIQKWNYEI